MRPTCANPAESTPSSVSAFVALPALVALSAFVADGTLPSFDSFTWVPVTVLLRSLFPAIDFFLMFLPFKTFVLANSTALSATAVPLSAAINAITATIIAADGRRARMRCIFDTS